MNLLDLQKAFDTVDHLILCDKLRAMGMCSVDWFKSYFSGRNQCVQVNDIFRFISNNLWRTSRRHLRSFIVPLLCELHGNQH